MAVHLSYAVGAHTEEMVMTNSRVIFSLAEKSLPLAAHLSNHSLTWPENHARLFIAEKVTELSFLRFPVKSVLHIKEQYFGVIVRIIIKPKVFTNFSVP